MPLRDVCYLIVKPFLGSKSGPTPNESMSRAVEHRSMKDAAADLTKLADVQFGAVSVSDKAIKIVSQRAGGGNFRVFDDSGA
jgi:anaerobic magnesium-protoporphyrin IX monomethyl ester cyclase